jgi:phosphatidylinositol alpha-1,6-mannosyltransferase
MPGKARPRLLLIAAVFPPEVGGIQLLTARLAQHLTGFETRIVAPAAPEPVDDAPQVLRAPASTLRLRGPARIGALNAYAATAARGFRPDVVISMHIATAPAAWMLGAPYLQYVYASELAPRPGLARRALRRASRVVSISSYSRDLALRHGARSEQTIVVLPGVDQPAAPPRPEEHLRGAHVIAVSRLVDSYKGHDTLIRAMPLVRSLVPESRARLIGDGRLRPYYERLAESIGASGYVDFLGAVSDGERDAELRAAAVFCLPVRNPSAGAGEGFGIALLEAGTFGLPVVAGRAGGAVDAVVDDETGILVDAGIDHEQLADALIRVLGDDDLRCRMGRGGMERARAFSWERMADDVGRLCHEAIAAGG